MTEYIVYRHGFDEVNQDPEHGHPEKMAVARIHAASPEEACRIASAQVSLRPGQHLSAEPAGPVDALEEEMNRTARAP